jgi:kynurenine formamidase
MNNFIDLSHDIEAGLITYPGLPAPVIKDYMSRESSKANYVEGVTFHIDQIEMIANTGTYVDSPFHRYPDGSDLADLSLGSLANLRGIVIRCTGPDRAIKPSCLKMLMFAELLFYFILGGTNIGEHNNTETTIRI